MCIRLQLFFWKYLPVAVISQEMTPTSPTDSPSHLRVQFQRFPVRVYSVLINRTVVSLQWYPHDHLQIGSYHACSSRPSWSTQDISRFLWTVPFRKNSWRPLLKSPSRKMCLSVVIFQSRLLTNRTYNGSSTKQSNRFLPSNSNHS